MKTIQDMLNQEKQNALLKKFTTPTFNKIVELFYNGLNNERKAQKEANFQKFWAQHNNLDKMTAIKEFKKTKGKNGYLRELPYGFIARQCKDAGLCSEADLHFLEKESFRKGFTVLFPWPRK